MTQTNGEEFYQSYMKLLFQISTESQISTSSTNIESISFSQLVLTTYIMEKLNNLYPYTCYSELGPKDFKNLRNLLEKKD